MYLISYYSSWLYFSLDFPDNSHVNNLKVSKTGPVSGWTFDKITDGSWNHDAESNEGYMCQSASWFGWNAGFNSGSISTILHGSGKAILDFGNCESVDDREGNIVVAYQNDKELASVGAGDTHIVEFQFSDGDEIKITENNLAFIQFNDLKIEMQGGFLQV